MPQIGPLEILVVSVLALIVFGPDKLPDMARSAGSGIKQLKGMVQEFKAEFDTGLDGAAEADEVPARSADPAPAQPETSQPEAPQPEPSQRETAPALNSQAVKS